MLRHCLMHQACLPPTAPRPGAVARDRGFTLVELLVVVSIAIVLLAAIFPFINMMGRSVRGGAGINTVNVAVTAARAFAVRDMSARYVMLSNVEYQGVAILFTPANELRLIETNPTAMHIMTGAYLQPAWVGYTDIPNRDPISLPRSVTAYGVVRDAGGLKLIAPPFAIRFDPRGRLMVSDPAWSGSASDLAVVYQPLGMDGLTDRYDVTRRRDPVNYTPDDWHPRFNSSIVRAPDTRMYPMPFEVITAVAGVVMVPTPEFRSQINALGLSHAPGVVDDSTHPALLDWMLTEGELLFFSRQTGVVMRER